MAKSREEEREEERRRKDRRQEREDEQERAEIGKIRGAVGGAPASGLGVGQQLEELIKQAQSLIEQTASLYRRFITGVDRKPPVETRRRLDLLIESLQKAPKSGASANFRFNSLKASYISNRDLWDKQLKDFESGKIKPIVAAMAKKS